MRNAMVDALKPFVEILGVSLKLGLTSFGGPIAHLGYFREEYVARRQWLDEKSYADLIALCQFLPGPASSQVGIAIGMMRGGIVGGIVSWIGFTLPSVLLLILFAYLLQGRDVGSSGWLHGLMIVAVAIVAQAVWGMARSLAPDRTRASIAICAAVITLIWPSALGQIMLLFLAGLIGRLFLRAAERNESLPMKRIPVSKRAAVVALSLFLLLLFGLPLLNFVVASHWLSVFDSFYRSGSLVFGGGHVVLPLLQTEVVPAGWVTNEQFLAGYGATQAVPGPLFTFAGYLGMVMNGWMGALVTTVAIFLPAFLLVVGVLPFWDSIRKRPNAQATLNGINAAVVGILIAAFYQPIWMKAIQTPFDFSLGLVAFALLMFWKCPPWAVVVITAFGGMLIS